MDIYINDSLVAHKNSYSRFAKLQTDLTICDDREVSIYIDIVNRLGYTFIFLFSTLPLLAEFYQKRVPIFLNEKSHYLFCRLGFLKKGMIYDPSFDYSSALMEHANVIKKQEDIFRTVTEITNEAPVKMSPELAALFISKAGEMFNNALEHSGGIVLGAKYYRNQKNIYCFSCYDTGMGIPAKVMSSIPNIANSVSAFRWAMRNGNSTAVKSFSRGLGLGTLQSFVRANHGAIRLCSGNVLYTYRPDRDESYHELNHSFCGTLFEMDIITDNNHKYILK